MAPLVSVIIPTYNRWPMLGQAIESVLKQSYQGFELIVVDDGSDDQTAVELMRYGSEIRLISQARRGVAAARNFGVRSCRGGYLAFLDSDDLWKRKKLEIQVAFMAAHEIQICQTEEVWIRRGVRVNPKKRHRKPSGDIFRSSLDLCLVSPSAVMMTRELFERVGGFDEALTICEDYDLWLRVALDTPVHLIPEPLVLKRGGHPDQLSHSTWGLDRFRALALKKLLDAGLQGEKRKWAIEALANKVAILTRGARKRKKEYEALIYDSLLSEFIEEIIHDRSADPRLQPGKGVSQPNAGALAQVDSG